MFCKYNTKRTQNWYFEWSLLTTYERALIHVDFKIPTPKDRSFSLGLTIFTITLFFFEIAYLGNNK